MTRVLAVGQNSATLLIAENMRRLVRKVTAFLTVRLGNQLVPSDTIDDQCAELTSFITMHPFELFMMSIKFGATTSSLSAAYNCPFAMYYSSSALKDEQCCIAFT